MHIILGMEMFMKQAAKILLLVALSASALFAERISPLKDKHTGTPVASMQNAFHDVYELYENTVVFISTEKTVKAAENPLLRDPFFRQFFGVPDQSGPSTRKQTGLGTGFILSEDGFICTNHHVVAKMDVVKVTVNDKEYTAKIVGSDPLTDIALLKINGATGLKPAYLGDSDKVRVGDWAVAIGNPFGLDRTFTVGVISAIARAEIDQLGNAHIQTDASINPGNSGGPLINLDGEVIGVNRMIYSQTGGSMGIGFAIPINVAKNVIDQIRQHGRVRHGFLGVNIRPLTPQDYKNLNIKHKGGVYVESPRANSPAADAGIRAGDVIIEAAGQTIQNPGDLVGAILRTPVGKRINVVVVRSGKRLTIPVTVAERKPGN